MQHCRLSGNWRWLRNRHILRHLRGNERGLCRLQGLCSLQGRAGWVRIGGMNGRDIQGRQINISRIGLRRLGNRQRRNVTGRRDCWFRGGRDGRRAGGMLSLRGSGSDSAFPQLLARGFSGPGTWINIPYGDQPLLGLLEC
jgi:hypothetical protein